MKKRRPRKNRKQPPESAKTPFVPLSTSLDGIAETLPDLHPSNFLNTVSNPRTKQILYELGSSTGEIPRAPDDKRPEWAVNAWKEFWRSLQLMPENMQTGPDASQLGYSAGIVSKIQADAVKASPDVAKLFGVFSELIPQVRASAAQSPPEEAANFFKAQLKGQERAVQLDQLSQRTKIFLAFAVAWEVIAEFKSTSELFRWLQCGHKDGKQSFLAPGTDSREIRRVCKILGLQYGSRGGRPRKKTRT
jgi:hypothetical protein